MALSAVRIRPPEVQQNTTIRAGRDEAQQSGIGKICKIALFILFFPITVPAYCLYQLCKDGNRYVAPVDQRVVNNNGPPAQPRRLGQLIADRMNDMQQRPAGGNVAFGGGHEQYRQPVPPPAAGRFGGAFGMDNNVGFGGGHVPNNPLPPQPRGGGHVAFGGGHVVPNNPPPQQPRGGGHVAFGGGHAQRGGGNAPPAQPRGGGHVAFGGGHGRAVPPAGRPEGGGNVAFGGRR